MLISLASVINKFALTNTQSSTSEDWTRSFFFFFFFYPFPSPPRLPSPSLLPAQGCRELKPGRVSKKNTTWAHKQTYLPSAGQIRKQRMHTRRSIYCTQKQLNSSLGAYRAMHTNKRCRRCTGQNAHVHEYFHIQHDLFVFCYICADVRPLFMFIVSPNQYSSVNSASEGRVFQTNSRRGQREGAQTRWRRMLDGEHL